MYDHGPKVPQSQSQIHELTWRVWDHATDTYSTWRRTSSSFYFPPYLTHWRWGKMAAISQTPHSYTFSWIKVLELHLRFSWSLLLRVQLTICQHLFRWWLGTDQVRSHYLNQWWLIYWHLKELSMLCTNNFWINDSRLWFWFTTLIERWYTQLLPRCDHQPNTTEEVFFDKFLLVTYQWLSARLQYLQCVSIGDAAVLL